MPGQDLFPLYHLLSSYCVLARVNYPIAWGFHPRILSKRV